MEIRVRRLTEWEEWKLWYSFQGELALDVLTYYGVCCAVGYVQGYLIGGQIVRWFG